MHQEDGERKKRTSLKIAQQIKRRKEKVLNWNLYQLFQHTSWCSLKRNAVFKAKRVYPNNRQTWTIERIIFIASLHDQAFIAKNQARREWDAGRICTTFDVFKNEHQFCAIVWKISMVT